jgi:hypothetical protein
MSKTLVQRCGRGRASVVGVCVAAAGAYLAIGLVRGELALAVVAPAITIGYAALLVALGRRGEPIALLSGDVRDERQVQVLQRAAAATGQALVVVLVAGALVGLATGSRYAATFCYLCAFGGLTFAAATVWYSRRG